MPCPSGPGGADGTSNAPSSGGLLQGSVPGEELTALLEAAEAEGYDWVAATVGANTAAGYQLATEASVMPIGGFNGTDPSPTLEQFQQWVTDGRIRYFIAGGGMGGGPGMGSSGTSSAISEWVSSTFSSSTVDGVTLYDLTAPR